MLAKQGIIPAEDAEQIVQGLGAIQLEIESGNFPWDASLEDLPGNLTWVAVKFPGSYLNLLSREREHGFKHQKCG